MWKVLQETSVPGEDEPRGVDRVSRGATRITYGRFPLFGISAVDLRKRLGKWFAKAVTSPRGVEILDDLDAKIHDYAEAKRLGELIADTFLLRLEVPRHHHPEVEKVRLWLKEEIRKSESAALGVRNRVESEVTRAVEYSVGFAAMGVVSVISIEGLGYRGVYAVAATTLAGIAVFFGATIALRRRPLFPRQIGFRLYALNVVCTYLESKTLGPVERTVGGAQGAIHRITLTQLLTLEETTSSDSQFPALRSSTELVHQGSGPDTTSRLTRLGSDEWHLFEQVRRLNEVAENIGDPFVHASLLKLEGVLSTRHNRQQLVRAISEVIDALSR
ncbi:MAG TPA: hypothetical protein VGD67_21090 [Pseudonocardiaceae bacterium]